MLNLKEEFDKGFGINEQPLSKALHGRDSAISKSSLFETTEKVLDRRAKKTTKSLFDEHFDATKNVQNTAPNDVTVDSSMIELKTKPI